MSLCPFISDHQLYRGQLKGYLHYFPRAFLIPFAAATTVLHLFSDIDLVCVVLQDGLMGFRLDFKSAYVKKEPVGSK